MNKQEVSLCDHCMHRCKCQELTLQCYKYIPPVKDLRGFLTTRQIQKEAQNHAG